MNTHGFVRHLVRIGAAAALVASACDASAVAQSSAPASATHTTKPNTTHQAEQKAQFAWQKMLLTHQAAAPGCFEAHYPDKQWRSVACVTAPNLPMGKPSASPTVLHPAGRTGVNPATIGGSDPSSDADYVATVETGHVFSSATGSFANVSGIKTVSSTSSGNGKFSLQLNSNTFANNAKSNTVPGCAKAPYSICAGWEQFVYVDGRDGDTGRLFIQYWALHYLKKDCPPSWQHYDGPPESCFFNSPFASVPTQALANIGKLVLSGSAAKGGQDIVTLVAATGMYSTHAYDNVLNLATNWNQAEFNIFGSDNSAEANFNTGVNIDVHLAANVSPPGALGCTTESTTGESTNLYIDTPCIVGPSGNELQFTGSSDYYANAPLITGVSPSSVKAIGGDTVTVTGFRLANPVNIIFGRQQIAVGTVTSSASNLTIPMVPACPASGCASGGAVVEITGPVGLPNAHLTATTYGPPIAQTPYVQTVSPSQGPGGMSVTVTGNGLREGGSTPTFYFGSAQARNVVCNSNTQCNMNAPDQSSGIGLVTFGSPNTQSNAVYTFVGLGGGGCQLSEGDCMTTGAQSYTASCAYLADFSVDGVFQSEGTVFTGQEAGAHQTIAVTACQKGINNCETFSTTSTQSCPVNPIHPHPPPITNCKNCFENNLRCVKVPGGYQCVGNAN